MTRRVRVGDVIELRRRRIDVDPLASYEEIGVRSFGRGIFHKEPVNGASLGNKRIFEICPGDLVFNNVFAWEGAVALAAQAEGGKCGSHRFLTYTARNDDVDLAFLRFFFVSEPGLTLLGVASPGSAGRNRTLAIDRFENLEIPLPDLAEQRRIVARLERLLDASRNLEEAQARTSREVLLPLFPLIVDRVLNETAHELRKIGDLVDVVPEVMKPGELPGQAQAFVGLQHIESHTGRRIGSLPLGSEKGDKRRFRSGDIVYGNLRPYLNKVWFADLDGVCSVDQRVLRPRAGVDGELLAYAIRGRSLLDQAIARTAALQLPRVRMRDFLEFEVPLAKSAGAEFIRERLTRTLGWAQQLVDLRANQKEKAAALGVSVLNRAFSGRL